MSIFSTYVPPGVYVNTINDASAVNIVAGLRMPLFIGVGQEYITVNNFEIIRGSSATADIRMLGEDVSSQFTGTNRQFNVANFPIVDGTGRGVVTADPNVLSVTIDDQPTGVIAVDGATGKVTLGTIPPLDAVVKVSYYFSRKDLKIVDEDVSYQADGSETKFKVNNAPIVSGNNGGTITTTPTHVTVKVNGVQVQVLSVNGADGVFTLAAAPADGDDVLVTYFTNTFQDTFDYLPQDVNILKISSVGNSPSKQDYYLGQDFVTQSGKIIWGSAYDIRNGLASTGNAFGSEQISATLVDNVFYMREASGTSDGTNKKFSILETPVEGDGRDIPTDDVSKVTVFVGSTVSSAKAAGPVEVVAVNGVAQEIILKNAPASGQKVYVTQYYNILTDDIFTITNRVASTGVVTGEYDVVSANGGDCFAAAFSMADSSVAAPSFATEGVPFPNAIADVITIPGYSVAEEVTLTFTSSNAYTVSSNLTSGGSSGSGYLDQTYVDNTTGLRFTIMTPSSFSFVAGDTLVCHVTKQQEVGASPKKIIPGLNLLVSNTTGVTVGSTGLVETFNKSGLEPSIGDSYFVSFDYEKRNYKPAVYTNFRDVLTDFGPLNVENRITLASYLAFLQGAPAIAIAQVKKIPNQLQATDIAFFDAMAALENPLDGDIRPNILVPLTTSRPVLQQAKKHCEKVSGARYGIERTMMFGYSIGTLPESAQEFAKGMRSERCLGVYPDGAVVALEDAFGREVENTVDGSFLAAALAGLACNPVFDVATPLTRKSLTGFRRLFRKIDAVQSNQTATSGLTVLTENQASIQIRQAITTDPSNILTREPSVVFIKDEIQQLTRSILDPFIGQKFLSGSLTDIEIALSSMFKTQVAAQKIVAYTGIKATQRATDPTVADVVAFYSPVFPLNWIQVTYTLRTQL
jgi:hypothetical protein